MASGHFDLLGKIALVTGGSRGIGFAIARGLAQQGADIVIVARDEKQLESARHQILSQTGKKVWAFAFDLADVKAITGHFGNIIAQTQGVDILVNCAGTTLRKRAEDITLKEWNKVIELNLTSVLVMCQAFCQHRKEAGGGGKIINIGSLMCHAARPSTAAYASAKGGLNMLTKTLAVEWAKYNINVNSIGPGYISTELTAPLKADKDFNRWVLSKTPLGRWGQPDDLVGAAILLASSAGDFITGQIIYVDGGWLALL
jgi:gluconate 5-dehydrogenase